MSPHLPRSLTSRPMNQGRFGSREEPWRRGKGQEKLRDMGEGEVCGQLRENKGKDRREGLKMEMK